MIQSVENRKRDSSEDSLGDEDPYLYFQHQSQVRNKDLKDLIINSKMKVEDLDYVLKIECDNVDQKKDFLKNL